MAHPFEEGVPMQAQCPCKATPQCTFLPTPSHFRLLLEGWKRNFCLRDQSPFTFLLSGMPYGTLHSLQQHERPGSKAHIDILQPRHVQQPHQQPGPKAHTKHLVDKS